MCIRDRESTLQCTPILQLQWTSWVRSVSYTHLDVYKRQVWSRPLQKYSRKVPFNCNIREPRQRGRTLFDGVRGAAVCAVARATRLCAGTILCRCVQSTLGLAQRIVPVSSLRIVRRSFLLLHAKLRRKLTPGKFVFVFICLYE